MIIPTRPNKNDLQRDDHQDKGSVSTARPNEGACSDELRSERGFAKGDDPLLGV